MKKVFVPVFIISLILAAFSCKKEPEPTETEILNEWIWDVMTDIYLWADDIDRNLYPTVEADPENFFYSLLNENDRFSWIVDDYQGLMNSFNNIELTSGISPYFIRRYNSNEVVAAVVYVAKGSPADLAGVKRGDIITNINGTTLDLTNYVDLFYSENLTLGFADYINNTLVPNDREVSITAVVFEENPVLYSEIIEHGDKEIGYIVYTGFSNGEQNKWIDSLDFVLSNYKSLGISEVIMDIRYNPGGYVSAVRHIASALAPADVPNGENILVNYRWNDAYQDYFLNKEGEDSDNLAIHFEASPEINLDLTDIYFLTSSRSASASELIIIALEPYMNVHQIGDSTYGKFYGSISIPDIEDPPRHEWAMQPIVFKYANSLGYTDFNEGLIPDVAIEDNILEAKPFGDLNDPILARAVEEITGQPISLKKQTIRGIDYEILPDPVREMKNRSIMTEDLRSLKPGRQ